MKKISLLLFVLTLGTNAQGSIDKARMIHQKGDKNQYPQLVQELIQEKMYFSAVPFIKEYLAHAPRVNNAKVDEIVDEIVTKVGVKQFEVLSVSLLEKSSAPTIRYILAKKYFNTGKHDKALASLKKIPSTHVVKPYALLLEASTYSLMSDNKSAEISYKECVSVANQNINKEKDKDRIRQLLITRDYCIVGIPRIQFASGEYELANSSYLDLPKTSFIWPEILFEEAWNSFYLKDYNRTLGKLVSYKAPVFDYIFNPEIDVLKALSYMEMCLWNDTNKAVEDFYSYYQKDFNTFKNYISSYGKDYQKFYSLVQNRDEDQIKRHQILHRALTSIARDPAYLELYNSFNSGKDEIESLGKIPNSAFKNLLVNNLKDVLSVQRNLIGLYARTQLNGFTNQMAKSFEHMSYIKLEIISKKKNEIYGIADDADLGANSRSRGDIANLKRNDKQYFWSFNGEFWADELGDYVFSLKPECK